MAKKKKKRKGFLKDAKFYIYNDTKWLLIGHGTQNKLRYNLQSALHEMVEVWLVIDRC